MPSTLRKDEKAEKLSTKSYDPQLTSLFASSLGPVRTTTRKLKTASVPVTAPYENGIDDSAKANDPLVEAITSGHSSDPRKGNDSKEPESPTINLKTEALSRSSRKRKRKEEDDNLEERYLQSLTREEVKENAKRRKEKHISPTEATAVKENDLKSVSDIAEVRTSEKDDASLSEVPQHETLNSSEFDRGLEKAARTVFLANVSTTAIRSKNARKTLLDHLASFLPSLPQQDTPHKVDSLRFRSTAFTSSAAPRKAAFAKKDLMDATTRSTNAYAVYTTPLAAREATKRLNGTMVLDRHLRVDSVAHPAKQDHRRCVFVGNLGFVDDESSINAAEDDTKKRPRKAKEAADVEEGLWRQFSKADTVESVRVVRDKTTRVGKGFAYVQFEDPNGVEKALLYNDKKFAPLLPRTLRVTRAKKISKSNAPQSTDRHPNGGRPQSRKPSGYQPKVSSQVQSLSGRAGKLLGRAGAAQLRGTGEKPGRATGVTKSPEAIVFEGYRATSKDGKGTLKNRGLSKKKGKPQNRSSKRGAAFKATAKKKVKN